MAIDGSWAIVAGVIEAPTATPRTARAASPTSAVPRSGAPARAARRQAVIGPNINGSGRSASRNATAPTKPKAAVIIVRPKAERGWYFAGIRALLRPMRAVRAYWYR